MTTKTELSSGVDIWIAKAAHWSLQEMLSTYLGEGANIKIVPGEHGKPRLADGGLEFNFSHSGELVVVAVSPTRPVGVDVEKMKPDRDFPALAERAFGADEAAAVRAAAPEERAAVFYRHWVRHEAQLKCLGIGLFRAGREAPLEVEDLDVAPGYAAAVALG